MIIKAVKLKNNGFNGLAVDYLTEVIKANRKTMKLTKDFPKDPIHKDLENLFKDLREHLLDICEITQKMDEKEKMFIIHESEVTGVEFDTEGFVIHGHKQIFGNKKYALNTPKVEEIDAYYKFEDVMDIMRSIATETKLYLDGEKKVSDEELVERWVAAGKDKSMDMETFKGLTAEEQAKFCSDFLQKQFGAVVLMNEEMDLSGMETSGMIEELQSEFTVSEEETIIPVAPKKTKKEKVVEPSSPE
jgi:ribosomal protein L14E/L6E/L27E